MNIHPNQKKFTYKGKTYFCIQKGRRVTVKAQRTACGQNVVAGVLDLDDSKWTNERVNFHLPNKVKSEVERIFS